MNQKDLLTRVPLLPVLIASLLASSLMSSRSHAQQRTSARQLQQVEAVTALPGKAKRWALVIGVDKYRDPQISPLKGSDNDARTLADALIRYAGFPADQVILMSTDQPEERQPTRVNLLRRLSNLASVVPKDGLLLISFAGHGMERNGHAYLLPSDAQISDDISFLEETAVSVARIKERIRATGVAQVIVLLDACRNDPGGRADAPNQLSKAYVSAFNFDVRNREVQAFATLYATAVGQRAYEYTERRQGYFTWAVVEGLKGSAANEKGEISLGGLVKYVQETVPKRIGIDLGGGKEQRPFAIIEGYRADDLVVAVAGQVAPVPEALLSSPPSSMDSSAVELAYWDTIKNSTDAEDFKSYLSKYPTGQFAELAKRRTQPKSESAATGTSANYNQVLGELMAFERETNEILMRGDKAAAEALMAEEFSLTQDGKTYNKKEYLSKVKAQKSIKSYTWENTSLSFQGENAVLMGVVVYKVKQLFIEITVKHQFTDTFIKRDGRWIVLRSQITTVK